MKLQTVLTTDKTPEESADHIQTVLQKVTNLTVSNVETEATDDGVLVEFHLQQPDGSDPDGDDLRDAFSAQPSLYHAGLNWTGTRILA